MDAGPLWLLNYKQQSPTYSNMCYLLWSHVESRIVFFITLDQPSVVLQSEHVICSGLNLFWNHKHDTGSLWEEDVFQNQLCSEVPTQISIWKTFWAVSIMPCLQWKLSHEVYVVSTLLKVQMKCFFLFPNLKEQQKSGRLPFTVS